MSPSPRHQYAGQFVLGVKLDRTPEGWERHTVGRWTLASDLPVCPVQDPNGRTVGAMIGFAVSPDGTVLNSALKLPLPLSTETVGSAEDAVYQHGGRFACVLAGGGVERLYLDPGGTLAAVYGWNAAASTGTLLAWCLGRAFRRPAAPLPTDGFYLAGQTSDPAVRRLLPNHYADLGEGEAVRHYWQEAPTPVPDDEVEGLVHEIVSGIRRNVEAAASLAPLYVGITAGRDSRMILACAHDVADQVSLYTFDNSGPADLATGRMIARRLRLPHIVISTDEPDATVREAYLDRTGFSGNWGKAKDFYQGVRQRIHGGGTLLVGFGGELGRASKMQRAFGPDTQVNAELIASSYGVAHLPGGIQVLDDWLSGVTWADPFSFLGQAYWEHRVGCWAAPHLYGVSPTVTPLVPFVDRRVVDAMARLPTAYHLNNRLPDDIVRVAWPALAAVPYQYRVGPAGFALRVARAVPRYVRRAAHYVGGVLSNNVSETEDAHS